METEKHLTDIQRAAAAMGRMGGRSTSPAKKAASRKNGALSVRPKQAAEPQPVPEQKNTTICARPGAVLLVGKPMPFVEEK